MWLWPNRRGATRHKENTQQRKTDEQPGSKRLMSEIAAVSSDLYEPLGAFMGIRPNRDPLLKSKQPSGAYGYPYGLFEEAIDKDAHLTAIITQRKAAVMSWEQKLSPWDGSDEAAEVKRVVEEALNSIGGPSGGGGFDKALYELLDAVPYGFAVSEIVWRRDAIKGGGREYLFPGALLSRHPRRFIFDEQGTARLLTREEQVSGEALPDAKFLVFAPYGRYEDPYGYPALRSVWWLAYFKRQVLRFWVMYCEKFGTPTAVLKHPLGATEREKRAYRRIIGTLQQETGLVVPEGVDLSLLEAERAGSAQTYKQLVEFANAEMSKALIGQTLTADEGQRGSYSLGRVHHSVRQDIVRQDAQSLMELINGKLIRWIVDLNFPGSLRLYPRWELTPPREDDLRLQLEIDRFFTEQGLPLDPNAMYARYGRTSETTNGGDSHEH